MDAQLVPAALAAETTLSPEAAALTVALLETRLRAFAEDAAGVQAVIVQLDDALGPLAAPLGGDLASLGALTLPVQAAWKGATALVSKVLTDSTGASSEAWLGLLSNGRAAFDHYLDTLRAVAGTGTDAADEALTLILAAKSATVAWGVAMRPVADFARLLDTALRELTKRSAGTAEPAGTQPAAGWRGQLQRAQHAVGEAVDHTADRMHLSRAEMLAFVLGPLQDARGRAAALPAELGRLHGEVERLNDLLELIEAQLRIRLGQWSPAEQEVTALVFAVSVRVPRLVRDLSDTRAELDAVTGYLEGLERLVGEGAVREPAAEVLRAEYTAAQQAVRDRLTALEQRAEIWRQHGHRLLQAGMGWVDHEIEVANLRLGLGQWTRAEADLRLRQLQRRGVAIGHAGELVADLTPVNPASG
ncbi:MAG: hypothetical protein QM619_14590 [Micropruina sp.]|uniref:hypothetical protein n=1 Tax=Micropruina sp. TaxID=2737536 RepID=UPI0039E2DBF4